MLKNVLLIFIATLFFTACNNSITANDKKESQSVGTTNESYGAKITPDNALTFDAMLEKMDNLDSMQTKVTGTVESVCQKKGCWVNIVSEDGREMFVKFKDYGFFLPKDCGGRKVVMEGEAFREKTSVEELRHYAEDGGASKEEIAAITEPKEELKFIASGVLLLAEK
ncbi:MAG TPA: DUF4920 domain-containing protein [Phaeodactylibacter sp.]|nr:DUF4920 domain-containing protein [Phaeodactylibacter sp.]